MPEKPRTLDFHDAWMLATKASQPGMGGNQRNVLASMLECGGWERNCGWVWDTPSGTEKILYSLVEGDRMGLIDLEPAIVQKAWTGLVGKIDADGKVFDVSAGTGPTDYAGYLKIPQGTETWGTGAFLLAASALVEQQKQR